MNDSVETILSRAERHVAEGEQLVARQLALIETLDGEHHPEMALRAQKLLLLLQSSLDLMRRHLEIERERAKG
jgi:hypothetical protein